MSTAQFVLPGGGWAAAAFTAAADCVLLVSNQSNLPARVAAATALPAEALLGHPLASGASLSLPLKAGDSLYVAGGEAGGKLCWS